MKRSLPSKRQIITILGIAALLSSAIVLRVSERAAPSYFEVAMRSSQPVTAQLFYDTGKGMNEGESIRLPVDAGESMALLRFALPAGELRAIRFDLIGHGDRRITIRDPRIVDISGHVVRDFSSNFTAFHGISQIKTSDHEIGLHFTQIERQPSLTITPSEPITLRLSRASFWRLAGKAFFLWFLFVSTAGICWFIFCPRRWMARALPLSLLVAFVYLFARTRFFAPINWDEEIFIWSGWAVKDGSIPYRDLFQPKPPVIFFANALGVALFGLKGFLFRIVPTAVAVSSILFFYVAMIRRRVVPWLTVLLTAQVALWLLSGDFHDTGLNDSETYGFAFTVLGFSLGSLASSLQAQSGKKIILQVLSGICFGLAVLSKELFVFSVIPVWLLAARRGDQGEWDWRHLLFSTGGGIAVGIAFLTYLVTHSAFERYLAVLRYARTFAADYCVDIGRFPKVAGFAILWPSWKMLHEQLYNFNHLAFVLPLWIASLLLIRRSLKRRGKIIELGIAMAAVILGMVAVSIGHCFWQHYFLMGTMGLLLLSAIGAEAVSSYLSARGRRTSLGLFIALAGLFLFVAKTPTQVMFTEQHIPQIVSWDPIVTETIERHSKPGDYILATEGPLIYAVMNRKNPIPVIAADDGVLPYMATENPELQMESLRTRLEKNLPKVCYFAGWFRPRQKMWHQLLYDPLLAKYHYVQVNDRLWYLPEDSN